MQAKNESRAVLILLALQLVFLFSVLSADQPAIPGNEGILDQSASRQEQGILPAQQRLSVVFVLQLSGKPVFPPLLSTGTPKFNPAQSCLPKRMPGNLSRSGKSRALHHFYYLLFSGSGRELPSHG